VCGVTRTVTVGNEIDEFVTEALRNNLLGTPLDLAVLNIARGRDTGVPPLNEARREFYAATSDPELKPYTSWADFVLHIKHAESLVNFIAAYGTHSMITSATTLAAKRAAAAAIVFGGAGAPLDRLDFLNATGEWADSGPHAKDVDGVTTTGIGNIDLWVGGLAEKITPFGGMLGSTFNFVFENQMEKLQDGDRFYYLERTAGMNFNTELENNTFSKLVMANTDATHLNALIFHAPALTLEVDPTKQFNADVVLPGPDGVFGTADDVSAPRADPVVVGPFASLLPLVIRDNPLTAGPDAHYLQYTGEDHIVMGGMPGDDIIKSSIGDDTLYGDAGNDQINGGFGNDQINGGAGDDTITDTGGDDVIHGGDGNDVIQGGNGGNLILGGFGSDFIVTGEDVSEALGGPGNDFIMGSKANEFSFGNEGDDWIECGTSDGAAGDNFDPIGNEPVKGNDVFLGDGGPDNVDGEGGDDMYIATPSEGDRFIGFGGFDWATYKLDPIGVTVSLDSNDRFFDQPIVPGSASSILSRLDVVEGLSGTKFGDFLFGDDTDAAALAGAGADAEGSILLHPGLITGLQTFLNQMVGTPAVPVVTRFDGGNIILGGQGSDQIMGRGGNDLIDGDLWLDVYISVRSTLDPSLELTRADTMSQLVDAMFAGNYKPDQLQIARVLQSSPTTDFDTAIFSGTLANYTFTVNGVAATAAQVVAATANDIITVTDTTTAGIKGDGTGTIRHIERLQFSDQALVIDGLNHAPVGLLTILDAATNTPDATPTEDQLLKVSIAGVTDADNPTGAITGPVSYFWQAELNPGDGVFTDITFFAAGEISRAEGTSFTPTKPFVGGIGIDSLVGLSLRVRAVYKDANGVLEQVFSAPAAPVANVNDAPVGTVVISDTTPTEGHTLTATNAFTDADGLTTAVFSYQWFRSDLAGTNFTPITSSSPTASKYTPVQADVLRRLQVQVTYTDDHGTTEIVTSDPTGFVGDLIVGTAAADTLTGTAFDDDLRGLAGADTINALAGNDLLSGGTGADRLNGGAGNDTFTYTMGDGADTVDGGADVDTLSITGLAAAETLSVVFTGTALSSVAGGPVTGLEAITADLAGGVDTLNYSTTTAAVTVRLGAGTASGFTAIANIENATGGAGNDRFVATVGDGPNSYIGGVGSDTYDLSGTTAGATVTLTSATSAEIRTDTLAGLENLIGSQGNDTLTFNGGANVLDGQGGDDLINAGPGSDTVSGGLGNDTLNGEGGNDLLTGGVGNDLFRYAIGDGADTTDGGEGFDTLAITGGAGNDTLNVFFTGTVLSNVANGTLSNVERVTADLDGGSDTLSYVGTTAGATAAAVTVNLTTGSASGFTSIAGLDNVTGGAGNDTLTGNAGANVLNGSAGNDRFVATVSAGNDSYIGGAGSDTYDLSGTTAGATVTATVATSAQTGTDTLATIENLTGSQGNDLITFDGVANVLDGQGGNDTINAGGGADTLLGGLGTDTLNGEGGNDSLNGGAGNDTLTGGVGTDVFVVDAPLALGDDTITDFDANPAGGQDLLDITARGITAATFGAQVLITAEGTGTRVDFLGDALTHLHLSGVSAATVTAADFRLA
jgi:Ca2+-binding RTX toxin-like protein